jgi:DNA-directed RNA polymerase beta' subunit
MGKRVDFSARTVITPDPNLRIDQVPLSTQQLLVPIIQLHIKIKIKSISHRKA